MTFEEQVALDLEVMDSNLFPFFLSFISIALNWSIVEVLQLLIFHELRCLAVQLRAKKTLK